MQIFLRVLSEDAIIVTQTCVCALLLTHCVCTYKHSCRSYFDFFYWARYYFLLLSPRSSPSVASLQRQVTKRKRMQKERIKAAMKTPVPTPDSQNNARRRGWSEQALVAFQWTCTPSGVGMPWTHLHPMGRPCWDQSQPSASSCPNLPASW